MRKAVTTGIAGFVAAAAVGLGVAPAFTAGTRAADAAAFELVSDQSSGTWVGGAARDGGSRTWRATVTRGDEKVLLGEYENRKDAEAAGKKEAKRRNDEAKVVDGPGCGPPLILC